MTAHVKTNTNGSIEPQQGGTAIPTRWVGLTRALGGLHGGDLFLVAGKSSAGKSVAALQMAQCAASNGYGTAVFSLEMRAESLVRRMIAATAGVDHQALRDGCLNPEERRMARNAISNIA